MRYLIGIWILFVTLVGIGDLIWSEGYRYRLFHEATRAGTYWNGVDLQPGVWSETIESGKSGCLLWTTKDGDPTGVIVQRRVGGSWKEAVLDGSDVGEFRFLSERSIAVYVRKSFKDNVMLWDQSCYAAEMGLYSNGFQPRGAPDTFYPMQTGQDWEIRFDAEVGERFGFLSDGGTGCIYWRQAAVSQEPDYKGMAVFVATRSFRNARLGVRNGPCG